MVFSDTDTRVGLALYLTAIAASLTIAPRTLFYWDSFGYLSQAISGDVGGLGFGRPVFILTSHLVVRALQSAGVSAWNVEAVLRVCWMLAACASAPLAWRLSTAVGLSPRAALLAGAAVALSPSFAHTSGTFLTDGAAAACFLLSCLCAVEAGTRAREQRPHVVPLAIGAGVAIGLAVGVREQSVLGGLTLVLLLPLFPAHLRWRLASVTAVAATLTVVLPMVFVVLTQPGYVETVRSWFAGMERDRSVKTFSPKDLAVFAGWVLSLGPVVAVAAAAMILRVTSPVWRAGTALFAVVVPSLAQLLAMGTFLGIDSSPRYLLLAFPGAVAMTAAMCFDAWARSSRARLIAIVAAIGLPFAIAVPIVRARQAPIEAATRDLPSRLARLPPRTVVVSGQPCPAVPLVQLILAREDSSKTARDWQTVCPGWSWPSNLVARLDRALEEGRPVLLDLRTLSWRGVEERSALEEVQRYRRQRSADESRGQIIVWE